jgi:hypothetical protein
VVTVVLIAFHTVEENRLDAVKHELKKDLIPVPYRGGRRLDPVHALVTKVLIAFHNRRECGI